MVELVVLGTAASIPNEDHENTHLAVVSEEGALLIDCASTPAVRLAQAGISLNQVTDLILTHFHPDHVSGVPLLLMNMWLSGRKRPLHIYGLHHCLTRVEDMMGFYDWENWPNFFPVAFHRLPEDEGMVVLEKPELRVFSSPVQHMIPTLGLRIEAADGMTAAYTCDTEPCPEVARLAEGADVLLHEATGLSVGHSSPRQAGEVAANARVGRLLLIHYPPDEVGPEMVAEAKEAFAGDVVVAEDFMRIQLS